MVRTAKSPLVLFGWLLLNLVYLESDGLWQTFKQTSHILTASLASPCPKLPKAKKGCAQIMFAQSHGMNLNGKVVQSCKCGSWMLSTSAVAAAIVASKVASCAALCQYKPARRFSPSSCV